MNNIMNGLSFNSERINHIDIIVLLFVFSLPYGGYISGFGGALGLPLANIIFLIGAFIAIGLEKIRRPEFTFTRLQATIMILYGAFVLITYISSIVNADLTTGFANITYTHIRYAGYFMTMIVILTYIDSPRRIRLVIATGFFSVIIASFLTIISSLLYIDIGQQFYASRVIAGIEIPFVRTIGVPLAMGSFGMFMLGVLPYYFLDGTSQSRKGTGFLVSICLFALFISQTRSAWLAFGGAVCIALFCWGLVWYQNSDLATRGWFALLIIATVVFMFVIWKDILTILIQINPHTVYARLEQYIAAMKVIIESPIFGIGESNIRTITPKGGEPHNAILRVGAGSGLIAASILIVLPMVIIASAFRNILSEGAVSPKIAISVVSAVVAVVIISQFVTAYGKVGWLWLATAASYHYFSPDVFRNLNRQT